MYVRYRCDREEYTQNTFLLDRLHKKFTTMGGLTQKSEDYKYIWRRFADPNDTAYDIENYDAEEIWNDPNKSFFRNKNYDHKQFKMSLTRLVKKLKDQIARGEEGELSLSHESLNLITYIYSANQCLDLQTEVWAAPAPPTTGTTMKKKKMKRLIRPPKLQQA
jgi:hypothetical protein